MSNCLFWWKFQQPAADFFVIINPINILDVSFLINEVDPFHRLIWCQKLICIGLYSPLWNIFLEFKIQEPLIRNNNHKNSNSSKILFKNWQIQFHSIFILCLKDSLWPLIFMSNSDSNWSIFLGIWFLISNIWIARLIRGFIAC
jgi:hypothetical protein